MLGSFAVLARTRPSDLRNREPGLQIEEVEMLGVHHHLDDGARPGSRADVEAADDRSSSPGRFLDETVGSRHVDVCRDLDHLRRDDRVGFDLDVGEEIGAEELRGHHLAAQTLSRRSLRPKAMFS